jgi:hypothetical protein
MDGKRFLRRKVRGALKTFEAGEKSWFAMSCDMAPCRMTWRFPPGLPIQSQEVNRLSFFSARILDFPERFCGSTAGFMPRPPAPAGFLLQASGIALGGGKAETLRTHLPKYLTL